MKQICLKSFAKAKQKHSTMNTQLICNLLQLNRSSYYKSISKNNGVARDLESYEIIKNVFDARKEKVGIRQIQMLLFRDQGILMNRKKIARLKNKFGLITKIRRKNKYTIFSRIGREHRIAKNLIQRKFNVKKPDFIFSTDITQSNLKDGKKAYLAAFKDLATKEIRSFALAKNANLNFVNHALVNALEKVPKEKINQLAIHSDQGFHFTHLNFRQIIKSSGAKQSMSRKGNCLDNSPIESFFGYLKDHVDGSQFDSYNDFSIQVTKEIEYYNNSRPQWNLKKMPPADYRKYLLSSEVF